MNIRKFKSEDETSVIALWEECGLAAPQNNPHSDIRCKTEFQPDLFFVGEIDGRIEASVMVGYEGHRGWINYLAVSPTSRRRGMGRRLLEFAEEKLRALGAPKINLQVRTTNHEVLAFYRAVGYKTDDVVSLGKKLSG